MTLTALLGCAPSPSNVVEHVEPRNASEEVATSVSTFCGDCHAMPPANSFPRRAWRKEVKQGFDFQHQLGHHDLELPPVDEVVSYFEGLAPEELVVALPENSLDSSSIFRRYRQCSSESPAIEFPAVSFIKWIGGKSADDRFLLFCDMRSGEIRSWRPNLGHPATRLHAALMNPAHIEPCDLDRDGHRDYLVAELASLSSQDHHRGGVLWLRPDPQQLDGADAMWDVTILAGQLGRVADVQPMDVDFDNDLDVLVAEFGHLRTGSIWLLENEGAAGSQPSFLRRKIDDRHGTIHIVPWDEPSSGRVSFVALISQEHEVIDLFSLEKTRDFAKTRLFTSGDPAFGSSGIQAVDLDRDGDLDVLYSNGDTFGSDYLKPYHGIHWLENRGAEGFLHHPITEMIGVQRALAADLDKDDDVDIVAVGLLPENLSSDNRVAAHDSIVMLEQTDRGEFQRHSLEKGNFIHAALEIADMDDDGDQDLCIGNLQGLAGHPQPWLTMWWNELNE